MMKRKGGRKVLTSPGHQNSTPDSSVTSTQTSLSRRFKAHLRALSSLVSDGAGLRIARLYSASAFDALADELDDAGSCEAGAARGKQVSPKPQVKRCHTEHSPFPLSTTFSFFPFAASAFACARPTVVVGLLTGAARFALFLTTFSSSSSSSLSFESPPSSSEELSSFTASFTAALRGRLPPTSLGGEGATMGAELGEVTGEEASASGSSSSETRVTSGSGDPLRLLVGDWMGLLGSAAETSGEAGERLLLRRESGAAGRGAGRGTEDGGREERSEEGEWAELARAREREAWARGGGGAAIEPP